MIWWVLIFFVMVGKVGENRDSELTTKISNMITRDSNNLNAIWREDIVFN